MISKKKNVSFISVFKSAVEFESWKLYIDLSSIGVRDKVGHFSPETCYTLFHV